MAQVLRAIIDEGLAEASRGLSALTTGAVRLAEARIAFLPLAQVPALAGGPDTVVVAAYAYFRGDIAGHLVLMFTEESARQVVEVLLEQPPGSVRELDALGYSALAEAANICGSHFLSTVSNRMGFTVVPSAPAIVTDMAGAILQAVVADLYLDADEALVVETALGGVRGHFILLPHQESMARLVAVIGSMAHG